MTSPKHTESAGGLIINHQKQVLMVQEFGEYWGLPRGHVKDGESKLEAAKREIYEETGITDLTKIADLGSYTRSTFDSDGRPNNNEIKRITFFAFYTHQTKLTPIDTDISDIGWYAIEEAQTMLINEQDLEFYISSIQKVNNSLS